MHSGTAVRTAVGAVPGTEVRAAVGAVPGTEVRAAVGAVPSSQAESLYQYTCKAVDPARHNSHDRTKTFRL
jgi:hypothetical protein